MPTDAKQLLAILERTCGNGWQNMLRAIDEAGWAVVPKVATADVLAGMRMHEPDGLRAQWQGGILGGALRLPDGGEHGEAD